MERSEIRGPGEKLWRVPGQTAGRNEGPDGASIAGGRDMKTLLLLIFFAACGGLPHSVPNGGTCTEDSQCISGHCGCYDPALGSQSSTCVTVAPVACPGG
jgi:hypothetical protein